MNELLDNAPRFLFFTGKGGVGKTSMACCTAVGLSGRERRVLLISTDPASNLDEVFGQSLGSAPTPIDGAPGLFAMNINPIRAAEEYRERMVGPYRGALPDAAVEQMEEQLSGACTVEIAGFSEFSKFVGDEAVIREYDHVVLDTAPTGHTLRLLNLPAAWSDFMAENQTGSSCLGPVSGLAEQKVLFEKVVAALTDETRTLLVLVSRAERMALAEAARASRELGETGLLNQRLILNGVFETASDDDVAKAFSRQASDAVGAMPADLFSLARTHVGFRPSGVMGVDAMRQIVAGEAETASSEFGNTAGHALQEDSVADAWSAFVDGLESSPRGVIMTMGKGGVGKTTMAALLATQLASRGHSVLLSTTDPAAHVEGVIGADVPGLHVERIDPDAERKAYVESILAKSRETLDADGLALLEEELRSPCIEEIAVFQAFARTVAQGVEQFIVLDTAPTGHTLLLLDSTQAYHREVAKSAEDLPAEVKDLLPRLRDPEFTRVVIVALPEATPVHEAEALQRDLRRAGVEPYGWVINRSFAVSGTRDPVLRTKGDHEVPFIDEVARSLAERIAISPWVGHELNGEEQLASLMQAANAPEGVNE